MPCNEIKVLADYFDYIGVSSSFLVKRCLVFNQITKLLICSVKVWDFFAFTFRHFVFHILCYQYLFLSTRIFKYNIKASEYANPACILITLPFIFYYKLTRNKKNLKGNGGCNIFLYYVFHTFFFSSKKFWSMRSFLFLMLCYIKQILFWYLDFIK